MKKLILMLLLLTTPCHAALTGTLINAVQLDDSPTSTTGVMETSDAEKMAFFLTYDETEVGNSISAAVTVDVSYDNSTWIDANFYDVAGGATAQTSETISADGNYYFWLSPDITAPYVRVAVAGTNTDADDIAVISCYYIQKR